MHKLSNDQKVYVSLPKKDYVQPTKVDVTISNKKQGWFKNTINSLLGK